MAYLLITLSLFISIILSRLIIPRILVVAHRKKLFDIPDERKVHSGIIPRLGGVSFVPTILFSLAFVTGLRYIVGLEIAIDKLNFIIPEFYFMVCGLMLLYLSGIKDDLVGLRYRSKFVIQIIAASLIPLSGLWINNLYGIFGINELTPWLGIPFTILLTVFIVNAINLIDGIDGLAAGGSAFSFLVIGLMFSLKGLWLYSMLAFSALGCLIPFLYFNVWGRTAKGTKMFMGDAGALSLGYLLSFLVIKYAVYVSETEPDVKNLVIPFTLLFIPMFDVLRVMLVRAMHHRPLFIADKNHLHHKCLAAGMTHLQATELILVFTIVLLVLNNWLTGFCNITVILIVDLLLGILLSKSLKIWKRK